MSEVTITEAVDVLDEGMFVTARSELQRLQKQIVAFRDQLERGEGVDVSAMKADIGRLTGVIESGLKAENRLEQARRERNGIGPCGYALDLDDARASIGCKLNRLRACCQAD
jgi:hypothetical protein